MDFDIKKLSNAEKLIFYSAIAAVVSSLLPWKDLGELGSVCGLSDSSWAPLILGWAPAIYMILNPNKLKPVIAFAGGAIALLWGIIYLATATIENPFTEETIYVGSFGAMIFCAAAAVLIFGLVNKYKNMADITAETENETSEVAAAATAPATPAAAVGNASSNVCAGFAQDKYLVSGSKIICGKATVATIAVSNDNDDIIYDIIDAETNAKIFRFVRTDKSMTGINPANNQTCFTWQRLSSGFGELFTGSKWQCGNLALSQNALRSMVMWVPRISWLIPTKYVVAENEKTCGLITGAVFSFTNARSVSSSDSTKSWEIMAAALILCEDEIG